MLVESVPANLAISFSSLLLFISWVEVVVTPEPQRSSLNREEAFLEARRETIVPTHTVVVGRVIGRTEQPANMFEHSHQPNAKAEAGCASAPMLHEATVCGRVGVGSMVDSALAKNYVIGPNLDRHFTRHFCINLLVTICWDALGLTS